MAQKLIQTNSLQQVQTLSPQQVLQVRLLEMPIAELEQRVKNELMDNGALEEKISSSHKTMSCLHIPWSGHFPNRYIRSSCSRARHLHCDNHPTVA